MCYICLHIYMIVIAYLSNIYYTLIVPTITIALLHYDISKAVIIICLMDRMTCCS